MNFHKIHKITINDFSLYKLKNEIELNLNDGVFCLAGANGLGKSTFIAIVSYALMGIVVDPKKNFDSINQIPEFYKRNEKFAETFFDGRIDESKRDLAFVSLEFSIKNFRYTIKRNFFDSTGLLEFSRVNIYTGEETVNSNNCTESDLLNLYKTYVKQDVEIATFEQFAFIQCFVLTFDESKKLIFWDAPVMNRVLYLFFGINPEDADMADNLRKKISKHESNMRNLQWNITQNERTVIELTNPCLVNLDIGSAEALIDNIKKKEEEVNELINTIEKQNNILKECNLHISDIAISIIDLESEYEKIFSSIQNIEVTIDKDFQIVTLLREIARKILSDEDVTNDFDMLKQRIYDVSESMKEKCQNDKMQDLKNIDKQISDKKQAQEEFRLKKERTEKILIENKNNIDNLNIELNKLKFDNEKIIKQYNLYLSANNDDKIEAIKKVIYKDKIQKIEETKSRDEAKEKLKNLEAEIRTQYHKAEETFLPIFKDYATNFLGLDIDVELKKSSNSGLYLALSVNNTERRDKFQLSESQQYFIDIALRFALIEIGNSQTATMFIDTPEGSLDIAYESRAGKMFGDFVNKSFDLIMTANINSSQLLKQLALKCRNEKMKIERMTNWTILSKVQQEEQQVIENAFNEIEGALNGIG